LCAGGNDRTYDIATKWAGREITILEQKAGEGKFRALQRGLAHSAGSIIMLTDADCILNSDSVKRLIYPIVLGEESVTTGLFQPLYEQKLTPFVFYQWSHVQYGLASSMTHSNTSSFLVGQNSALIRTVVEEAYDTTLPNLIGEDTYLALYAIRAGHRILRVPDSYVSTPFPETFMQYVNQRNRWRRDQLIHQYQFGNKNIILKALFSVCKHLAWLLLPLAPFLFGAIGFVGWILLWLHTISSHIYRLSVVRWLHRTSPSESLPPLSEKGKPMPLADDSEKESTSFVTFSLLKLILAESCAVISLAIHLANPKWRYRW
jgi:cellulose synthase/poly-beta-1,6-N-acetylglucosamine synthase-like glycosyltransferase